MRAVVFLVFCLGLTAAIASEKKIFCFFRPSEINISYINVSLCTHLISNAVGIADDDIMVLNPRQDLPDNYGRNSFGHLNALHQKNPSLKTILALSSRGDHLRNYSQMVSNSESRERFADNVLRFCKQWGFDGFDITTEYLKAANTYTIQGKENNIELFKALKQRFHKENLTISASVAGTEMYASEWYNISEMNKYLDFIIFLPVTFYGSSNKQVAVSAPLYSHLSDTVSDKTKSVEAGVFYWLSQGVSREKIIVGIPTTGRTYTLARESETRPGALYSGIGAAGPRTNNAGILSYNEICELQNRGGWAVAYDEVHRAPYTFKGNQWISYSNVKSVKEKAEFIARLNLGGAKLYNVHYDDWMGICGEAYPLLRTINGVLRNGHPVSEERLLAPVPECTQPGHMRDPHSCGLFVCTPNATGGYKKHNFQCSPGNCFNPLIGKMRAEEADVNFFICTD